MEPGVLGQVGGEVVGKPAVLGAECRGWGAVVYSRIRLNCSFMLVTYSSGSILPGGSRLGSNLFYSQGLPIHFC